MHTKKREKVQVDNISKYIHQILPRLYGTVKVLKREKNYP